LSNSPGNLAVVLAAAHTVGTVLVYLLGACLLVVYFVPTWLALARRHHWIFRIFVLNLLLGWTVIGWAVTFHMACTSRVATKGLWRRSDIVAGSESATYIPTAVPLQTRTEAPGGVDERPNT
jgi:hypothetical protein